MAGLTANRKRCHSLFIQNLFMGSMLINDIKLILKFHQPVSVKKLPDSLMAVAGLGRQPFFKQIQLFWLLG